MRPDPRRLLADLDALHRRTGDEHGAQREAWTPGWVEARRFLGERLAAVGAPLDVRTDGAGNLWATLAGGPGAPVAVGSHLDSVPGGGRLDGALGVLAGVELLRAAARRRDPLPGPLVLVDWADEEGTAFGRSLLGSAAATGQLRSGELAALRDRDGTPALERLAAHGADPTQTTPLVGELAAYLELHIEQGTVLERAGAAVAVPVGVVGIQRWSWTLTGRAGHAGTGPLDSRADAGLAAAEAIVAVRRLAAEHGGLGTVGHLRLAPGLPTVVPRRADLVIDLRHPDEDALARLAAAAASAVHAASERHGARARHHVLWQAPATAFTSWLIDAARAAVGPAAPTVVSGALHDAVSTAHAGVPTAMVFVRSTGGISHDPAEHSSDQDIAEGLRVLAALASAALDPAGRLSG